jgi:signal transduction histidine kinase
VVPLRSIYFLQELERSKLRATFCWRDEAGIVVSISDTGVGIPPEMLEQVFELFSQVERSSHLTRGGPGIGLTLAKGLAEGSTSP